MISVIELWLPAVVAVAAWPVGIVVMVLAVLVLVPREQKAATLNGIAEVIRAARGTARGPTSAPGANAEEHEEGSDAGRVAALGASDASPAGQSDGRT